MDQPLPVALGGRLSQPVGAMASTIPSLPLDIIINVLYQLEPSRAAFDDASINTLIACSEVNSIFREATSLSTLWQDHYTKRYIHCNEVDESERWTIFNGNYTLMYAARRRLDRDTLRILDRILFSREGRCDLAGTVAKRAFDAWDVLEIETHTKLGDITSDTVHPNRPHLRTRVFWARALLKGIARRYAFTLWGSLAGPGNDDPSHYVEAYSALSCFFGKSPKLVSVTTAITAPALTGITRWTGSLKTSYIMLVLILLEGKSHWTPMTPDST
jgi:F-box protein 21